ncbi:MULTISPECIES: type I toxin-antitoxin system Fst family toxin [Staphylococcus]
MTCKGGVMMRDILINILATITSGCIIAWYTNWLRCRNDKNNRRK